MTAQPRVNLTGLDLRAEIDRLRTERNAVILAHYYQRPEIQDLADFVGDSLELSRKAAATDAEVIAFCGVKFMADTAKILSPQKIVVLPDLDAGCSLEDSCPPDKFKAFREAHPDHIGIGRRRLAAEFERIADEIGEVLDFGALVIMREDHRVALGAQTVDLGAEVEAGEGFAGLGGHGVLGVAARQCGMSAR